MTPNPILIDALADFLAGQYHGLAHLARHCHDDLLRMVESAIRRRRMHVLPYPPEPPEVLQQVYLHLLENHRRAGRVPVLNGLAYLRKVIVNELYQQRRTTGPIGIPVHDLLGLDAQSNAATDAYPLTGRPSDLRDLTVLAARALSATERRIVVLRMHGASWKEIAIELGDDREVLRTVYRRALRKLRSRMRD